MRDKRPWTPGPWVEGLYYYTFSDYHKITASQRKANMTIASKAPELAEILIDLVRVGDAAIDIDVAMTELSDIYDKAKKLLKECGYGMDQDTAE